MSRLTVFLAASLAVSTCCWMSSCKKVTGRPNAEKNFYVYMVDSNLVPLDTCFDKVYALGKTNIDPCTQVTTGIKLPLNIQSERSTFYFIKDEDTNSLTIHYKAFVDKDSEAFGMRFDVYNVESSFKINKKCIPNLSYSCKDDEAIYSVAIIH